jgi:hypothetical protein
MPFKKGHSGNIKGKKKGTIHKSTLIKLALADRIKDFDNSLYTISKALLTDDKTKLDAWKTLVKLRVPAVTKLVGDKENPLEANLKIEVKKYI